MRFALHGFALFCMLHGRCTNRRKLDEIFREQKIEAPIQRDPALLLESGKFAEINRALEPPRDKAGEADPEHFGHSGAFTNGGKLTES